MSTTSATRSCTKFSFKKAVFQLYSLQVHAKYEGQVGQNFKKLHLVIRKLLLCCEPTITFGEIAGKNQWCKKQAKEMRKALKQYPPPKKEKYLNQ